MTFALRKPYARPNSSVSHDIDRFIDDFFQLPTFAKNAKTQASFVPKVNVHENEKNIVVSAELPGMDENDIQVLLDKDVLTLKGEKVVKSEENEDNYHRMERHSGSFQRSFTLPVEVDQDQIKASYKKGVLEVVLPKSEKALEQTRQIAIDAE